MSFLGLFGLVLLAILILVPLLIVQGVALASALPDLANNAQRYLLAGLELLDKNGLLPGTTDQVLQASGRTSPAAPGTSPAACLAAPSASYPGPSALHFSFSEGCS